MKNLEKDLKTIRRRAMELYDEDWEFSDHLSSLGHERVDKAVKELFAEVSAEIDCRKCRNCCKYFSPQLDDTDIKRLAEGLGMTTEDFTKKYLIDDDDEPDLFLMKDLPCPFLDDNGCMHYELRPAECRRFPYLDQDGFIHRSMASVLDQRVCPIVFNVYQELKKELRKKPLK